MEFKELGKPGPDKVGQMMLCGVSLRSRKDARMDSFTIYVMFARNEVFLGHTGFRQDKKSEFHEKKSKRK